MVGCCVSVLLYGLVMYPHAPYKLCEGVKYCGKNGEPESYEFFKAWKHWEGLLIICWPFGLIAAFGLKRLHNQPHQS